MELNALAMKRGEPATYTVVETQTTTKAGNMPNLNFRGMHNQRWEDWKHKLYYINM